MKVKLLLLGIGFLITVNLLGQDIESLKAQARAAGYTDAQIEQAIQSARLGATPVQQQTPVQEVVKQPDNLDGQSPVFINKPKPEDVANKPSGRKFGIEIFASLPNSFQPNDLGPVPDDYVLGTGDELQVSIWGQNEMYQTVKLDRSGQIQIPTVGLISVSGLTLSDARNVIKQRMSQSYSGLKTGEIKFAMTLTTIRSIRVFIGGFVNYPGAYRLSGSSDILSVLYAAGGLSNRADLRRVHIIHTDGSIDSLDLYENLLGLKSNSKRVRIDNNDLVMVQGESFTVNISGGINRPQTYDLKPNEGFLDLLKFAGGLTASAWLGNVEIDRIVPGKGKMTLSFNGDDVLKGISKVRFQPGDLIRVPTSTNATLEKVEIVGAVKHPGFISYQKGLTIKDAVEKIGGIWKWTYLDRAELVYVTDDSLYINKSFHLGRALEGQVSDNLTIPERSKIYIKSIWEINDRENLEVLGFVHEPKTLPYYEGITLGSAIFLAGGFSEFAFEGTIEVSRITKNDSTQSDRQLAYLVSVNNKESLTVDNEKLKFELKPFDKVYVRKNPYFIPQKNVTINGAVKFPGPYALSDRNERLSDLVRRAGGLKSFAFPEGVVINRKFDDIGRIPIDYGLALKNPSSPDNIVLMDGDQVYIPEQKYTVSVKGAVGLQTSILFVKGKNYKYYIEQAGGYAENADESRVRVQQSNGSIFVPDNYWISDPEILAGSTIYVPVKLIEDKIDWKAWVQLTASVLTSLITILVLVQRI